MSASLIVGNKTRENLSRLFEVYKIKILENASDFLGYKISEYHPILGSHEFLSRIEKDRIDSLTSESHDFVGKRRFIDQYHLFLNELELGSYFFGTSSYSCLSLEEMELANGEVKSALQLIREFAPWMWNLYELLISDLVLVKKGQAVRFVGGGGSGYEFVGLIVMSLRPDSRMKEVELATAIVHELGHNVFFLLQSGMLPIEKSSWDKKIFSGVRKELRPAYASLHAIVALMYMLDFTNSLISKSANNFSSNIVNELRLKEESYSNDLKQGLQALSEIELTPLGKAICYEAIRLLRN